MHKVIHEVFSVAELVLQKKPPKQRGCFGGHVTPLGFEPRLSESKSLVLPLHYGVISSTANKQLNEIYIPKNWI